MAGDKDNGSDADAATKSSSSNKKKKDEKKKKSADDDTKSTTSTSTTSKNSSSPSSPLQIVLNSLFCMALLQVLYRMVMESYNIRLYAIEEYGRVIHEFDPYFNYRATEYLWAHGWNSFSKWFDYKVWYPLGRPVGTTIYPGMQVTACLIKQFILPAWSINDICVFMPAWFGMLATLSVAWLTWSCTSGYTYEFTSLMNDIPVIRKVHHQLLKPLGEGLIKLLVRFTGSDWGIVPFASGKTGTTDGASSTSKATKVPWTVSLACSACSAAIMAIVPAHLLRSVGGGYDNESVAVTAMCLTYSCWTTSLKQWNSSGDNKESNDKNNNNSILWNGIWGVLTGVAYFNMVAAWGGYVFVLNLIGIHAGILVLLGRYSRKLWIAYSCFYVVGTALAIRVPVVGMTPLKSLEQLGALAAFGGLQLIELSEFLIRKEEQKLRQGKGNNKNKKLTTLQAWKLRLTVFLTAGAIAGTVVGLLASTGYFGPISSRVRGLFVKHTKTGNPLVDSVAEHQAASPQAYFQYLNNVCYLAPIGFAITALFYVSDSSSFLLVYGLAAYYFSHRMVRLILLTAPIASCFGGMVLGRFVAWMFNGVTGEQPLDIVELFSMNDEGGGKDEKGSSSSSGTDNKEENKAAKNKKSRDPVLVRGIRIAISVYAVIQFIPLATSFWEYTHTMAHHISHPSIIMKGTLKDGSAVTVDDYREAYWWLRDNTPEDARILAWWDYGYQITGISDRTTIADGNTWNHEHIAFLGRILTSPEKDAHRIARHLADYVLVWAGGGGDDLAKSPHLRRIANSVFRGLCSEPTCREFGFYSDRTPTEDMEDSLLYKLVANKMIPEVEVDKNRFKEVFRTKFGKVRIYKIMSVSQESKGWVADPANRICDAPGSWVCRGQYPPALRKILAEKKDFKQLEDFNVKDDEDDSEYQREYMENVMKGGGHHASEDSEKKKKKRKNSEDIKRKPPTKEEIEALNEVWENNEMTTLLWQLISQGDVDRLQQFFQQYPQAPHTRSEDGRGPMWWAHEYGQDEMVELLKRAGVSDTERKDKDGIAPIKLSE